MPKFSVFARKFWLNDILKASFENQVMQPGGALAPGQLRKNGDWYYLTYLRVLKVKNFDPTNFESTEQEMNTTRVAIFRVTDSHLLVNGSKGDVKEVSAYLEALCQPLNPDKAVSVKLEDFYRIDTPVVDLANIISILEGIQAIAEIKKVRMRKIEVKLGRIDNCVINTQDYGAVRAILADQNSGAFGTEIFLKKPEKTSIYFDQDGQVRVMSKAADTNVEELAIEFAKRLK